MTKQDDGCLGCATFMLTLPILGVGCFASIIIFGLFIEFIKWIFTSIF